MTSPEPLDLFSSEPELPEQIVSLAEKVAKEATILRDLVRAHTEQVEHTADETVHLRLFGLDHTSFSECDREDLQKLAFCLDEILKSVCGAQDCVLLYNLSDAPLFAGELTRLLHRQAEELRAAISLLQGVSMCFSIVPSSNNSNQMRIGSSTRCSLSCPSTRSMPPD